MIVYAMIVRARDGMALSASTDYNDEFNGRMKDCKRYMKLIAKKTVHFPERCTLNLSSYVIHFITSLGISFILVCQSAYPTVLAFSFLDDLMKEFVVQYDCRRIDEARRPYAFIEFDNFIYKTRLRYNNPCSLTTRLNLSELSAEIKQRPPHMLRISDVEPIQNGLGPLQASATVGVAARLEPISWVGFIAICLTGCCALTNFYRGISSLSISSFEEYHSLGPGHGFSFLVESAFQCCQIYLVLIYNRYRHLETGLALGLICLCNLYVWEVRDTWQVILHIVLGSTLTLTTLRRKFEVKLPNYIV